MPKIRTRQTLNSLWLRNRELGLKFPLGHSDRFYKTLYSSIQPVTHWEHGENLSSAMHGGVFNLEFSPDGSMLLAACEKKSILMFDPLCRKLIHSIGNAHEDCVNCVRFLDQRMFATCSDDHTVALWDARNLKQRIRTLQGHTNWVKNIEYSPSDSLLVTSGFDGSIYTWDINSFSENNFLYTRAFHTNGLMRTRLSPDASKMLICTTSGYIIVVHNLNLSTLPVDLAGFKPNMYRLMQLSQTTIPIVASFTHLFSQNRTHNRIEFLTDFPVGDDAEVISSLQIHPQGWCALSRNVSNGEKSEWTCVHDIQERDMSEVVENVKEEDANTHCDLSVEEFDESTRPAGSEISSSIVIGSANHTRTMVVRTISDVRPDSNQSPRSSRVTWQAVLHRSSRSLSRNSRPDRVVVLRSNRNEDRQDETEENTEDEEAQQEPATGSRGDMRITAQMRRRNVIDNSSYSTTNVELHLSSSDVWEAQVPVREARSRRDRERERGELRTSSERREWMQRSANGLSVSVPRSSHTVVIIGDRIRAPSQSRQIPYKMYAIPRNHKIHQNVPRLTHYIQEPNVGAGYIKELCFSADGRLICSPFAYGVRLLAFSNECQELSDCVPATNESVKLHELAMRLSHTDIVVSTKFSPKHCLLVSGCLSGRIVWHQPVV